MLQAYRGGNLATGCEWLDSQLCYILDLEKSVTCSEDKRTFNCLTQDILYLFIFQYLSLNEELVTHRNRRCAGTGLFQQLN